MNLNGVFPDTLIVRENSKRISFVKQRRSIVKYESDKLSVRDNKIGEQAILTLIRQLEFHRL